MSFVQDPDPFPRSPPTASHACQLHTVGGLVSMRMSINGVRHRANAAAALMTGAIGLGLLGFAWRADLHWLERHMLRSYYVTGALDRSLVWLTRGLALVSGLALLAGARALGRMIGAWRLRDLASRCARIGLAIGLALLGGEVILATTERRPNLARDPHEIKLGQPDAGLGWIYRPSRTTVLPHGGRPVAYAINA